LVAVNQWLRQEKAACKLPDLWQAAPHMYERSHFKDFGMMDTNPASFSVEPNRLQLALTL
jgi:hypothetical protein